MTGYAPTILGAAPKAVFLDNSTVSFSNLRLSWRIDAAYPDEFQVNYSLVLTTANPAYSSIYSKELLVSRENNSLYLPNRALIGTWPYWLAPQFLSPDYYFSTRPITIYHAKPEYVFEPGVAPHRVFTDAREFLSLPQGGAWPNRSATSNFFDSNLRLSNIGAFKTDRLLVSYPFLASINGTGINVSQTGAVFISPTGDWVGVFDRLSGVMLAWNHVQFLTDDILLHSGFGIREVGFRSSSLELKTTNLSLQTDWIPDSSLLALPIYVAVSGTATGVGILYYRKTRKHT